MVSCSGLQDLPVKVRGGLHIIQSATLAAGPGPEASGNLVGPVKNLPGPVKFTLNY